MKLSEIIEDLETERSEIAALQNLLNEYIPPEINWEEVYIQNDLVHFYQLRLAHIAITIYIRTKDVVYKSAYREESELGQISEGHQRWHTLSQWVKDDYMRYRAENPVDTNIIISYQKNL